MSDWLRRETREEENPRRALQVFATAKTRTQGRADLNNYFFSFVGVKFWIANYNLFQARFQFGARDVVVKDQDAGPPPGSFIQSAQVRLKCQKEHNTGTLSVTGRAGGRGGGSRHGLGLVLSRTRPSTPIPPHSATIRVFGRVDFCDFIRDVPT